MPKIFKKTSKISSVLFLILCLAVCLSLSEFFSSLITVGGFSSLASSNIKQQAFDIYAICLYETQTKASANEMSELVQKKLGAGYVYQTSNAFCVLASAYENLSDAQNVESNLKENGTQCKITKISFKELAIKENVLEQEKTALLSAVTSFFNTYKKLYDLSVSIDTNLYTEIQAKVILNDIISEQSKQKTNFETYFNSKLTTQLLKLKLSLSDLSQVLTDLSNFSSTQIPYSSMVKNTYIKVLFLYDELTKSF